MPFIGSVAATAKRNGQQVPVNFFGCCRCGTMLVSTAAEPLTPGWKKVGEVWLCSDCASSDTPA